MPVKLVDPTPNPDRSWAKTARTIYWFHEVRIAAGDPTMYGLELELEPEAFGTSEHGDPYHANKWPGYSKGKHKPNARLVDRVESHYPGTKAKLENVLWDTCNLQKAIGENLQKWVVRLHPSIGGILLEADPRFGTSLPIHKVAHSSRLLKRLENRGTLDALAALVILVRLADEREDVEALQLLREPMYRALLILGADLEAHGIGESTFRFFSENLLPLTLQAGEEAVYLGVSFQTAVQLLESMLGKVQTQNPGAHNTRATKVLLILGGKYGYDWFYFFKPIILKRVGQETATAQLLSPFERDIHLKHWATQTVVDSQSHPHFPLHLFSNVVSCCRPGTLLSAFVEDSNTGDGARP